MLDDSPIERVRAAVAAYFRAAGALADASVLLRLAATAARASPDEREEDSDEAWLLDRAHTYREKSGHMSKSGGVLLAHAWDWIGDLDDADIADEEAVFAAFARAIEKAANGYAGVVEALTATPLTTEPEYQKLVEELRLAVRFLQSEAAVFEDAVSEEPP